MLAPTPRADRLIVALEAEMAATSARLEPAVAARVNQAAFEQWLFAVLDPALMEDVLAEQAWLTAGARAGRF